MVEELTQEAEIRRLYTARSAHQDFGALWRYSRHDAWPHKPPGRGASRGRNVYPRATRSWSSASTSIPPGASACRARRRWRTRWPRASEPEAPRLPNGGRGRPSSAQLRDGGGRGARLARCRVLSSGRRTGRAGAGADGTAHRRAGRLRGAGAPAQRARAATRHRASQLPRYDRLRLSGGGPGDSLEHRRSLSRSREKTASRAVVAPVARVEIERLRGQTPRAPAGFGSDGRLVTAAPIHRDRPRLGPSRAAARNLALRLLTAALADPVHRVVIFQGGLWVLAPGRAHAARHHESTTDGPMSPSAAACMLARWRGPSSRISPATRATSMLFLCSA